MDIDPEGIVRSGSSVAYDSGEYYKWHPWWGYEDQGRIVVQNNYEMVTSNHRRPFGSGSGDNGGSFLLRKWEYHATPASFTETSPYGYFHGNVVPGDNTGEYYPPGESSEPSDASLNAMGTTAIARTIPTNPSFSLAQFIGELHEGLPSVSGLGYHKARTKELSSVTGSEYLNVEFGWKPLISDIQKFARAVKTTHKVINQYRKDSDVKIRRRLELDRVETSDVWYGSFFPWPSSYGSFSNPGQMYTTVQERSWFSGAFRYHVPVSDTALGKMVRFESEANKLLGTRLTPSVLWELAPWSWAADWFTNTGDIMTNISALGSDGLVLQYGYVMWSSERTTTKSCTFGWQNKPASFSTKHVIRTRKPATPYGFGFDMSKLTPRQTAILAAVGLSRS